MTWRIPLVALALLGGFGLPHAAWAAPTSTPSGKPQDKAAADAQARELFQQGDAAYAKGRYEQALGAFQEAYELSNRPQLLFNISNTLERLGRYPEALEALEKYLASGKAKDRETIEERLASLKKRVEQQRKADQEEEDKRKAAEGAAKPVDPPKDDKRTPKKEPNAGEERSTSVVPYVVLGAGGVALVTAGVFGLLTLSARSEIEPGCGNGPDGRLCKSDVSSALDRDYTFGLITDIAAASGVVLGGVGIFLLLTQGDSKSTSGSLGKKIVIRSKGPGMELVGTF